MLPSTNVRYTYSSTSVVAQVRNYSIFSYFKNSAQEIVLIFRLLVHLNLLYSLEQATPGFGGGGETPSPAPNK